MDLTTGTAIAKTVMDLVKNENVLNKSVGVMGMLFPFAGLKQKAIEMYVADIEKSDLPEETKVFMILNTKKTFKKIKNQKAIAEVAMKNAEPETDFSEKSGVSEEWLERFMDSAGFVGTEEIQWIWGKILANEFERPGSTPPNMIRILSEITPELASAFRYICSMCMWILPLDEKGDIQDSIKQTFVPYNKNDKIFRERGVSFNVLNELETLGVIRFESLAGYVSKGITADKVLICIGDQLEVVEEYPRENLPIGNVMLTSTGEALGAITDFVEISDYYEMVKKYMLDKGVKFAEDHDYYTEVVGDEIVVHRKNFW